MRQLAVLLLAAAAVAAQGLEVRVDPRVELMSLLFRLAGNAEYNHPLSKSPYAEAVEKHFGAFREHAAVGAARELRRTRSISYDAVMSLAVHLTDGLELKERLPFDPKRPRRLDGRWRAEDARAFLVHARAFVKDTQFAEFLERHAELHKATVARLEKKVNERPYLAWFDAFFAKRERAGFYVIAGMLNGPGNYGVGVRYHDGREEITPVLGVYRFDENGVPVFGDEIVTMVVHEFCHSYTNALVDGVKDELEAAGRVIFPHRAQIMRRQAYGNWLTMMYESLVRACVVRYVRSADGEAAASRQLLHEFGRGFTWTADLEKLLAEYEADRERYKTLESFMPRIVAFFDAQAKKFGPLPPPKVVALTPANGATDVDPALKTITITFDRAMMDRWAVVRTDDPFPELDGKPSFDKGRKVLTLPVRLKPATTYRFHLNSERFRGFTSVEGIDLVPLEVTFRTK